MLLCLAFAAMLAPQSAEERPLPDIATLMHEVEAHQRDAEKIEKDYIYREESTLNQTDKGGSTKKSEERVYEIFFIGGVRLQRLVRKDNRDLSPDEIKKEDERLDKEIAKAKEKRARADAEGKETDTHGRDEVTVSRILELGKFSNARRQTIDGRPTIVVDYAGDPQAKTHTEGEAVIKDLTGTVWVDEQDKVIVRGEGHFVNDFKVAGGLVADIKAGTSFSGTFKRVNQEVWLPADFDAQGHFRYLLFLSLNGNAHIRTTDYRKFKAKTTILPTITEVPSESPAEATPDAHR